jgi:hypothetical protein
MPTVNVIVSTPGPRLVTPTVTLPDAGCVFNALLAQLANPRSKAAAAHSHAVRAGCMEPTS